MQPLRLPHRIAPGMCPVNGIRDLVQWRTGRDWSNEFVHGLGQGGGFAYLRINVANPPRQVYWGTASPRQHAYLAGLFKADFIAVEDRSFKYSWNKARAALDEHTPPILGPLDMYHLPFYPAIYHQRHIPIHFLLLVGYDDQNAYVLDTGQQEIQDIPLAELELAWDVNVPGMGKRNRLTILNIPEELDPTDKLIKQAIADQCQLMLEPPLSMLGIPAMQKLGREIHAWPEELGQEASQRCLQQVREYLNSPPDNLGNHLTAGRDLYITFLVEAGGAAELDFSQPIAHFQWVLSIIPKIAQAIHANDLMAAAAGFIWVAEEEKLAYRWLRELITEPA
ncbi:MAG: hypothetical protein C3F13_13350 [Anaerolineales bacterium]|nr:DUF4872 domain-containing protein [Anaerolineae bacterium]PWB51423.1 MAG: hypothetical protein C3F13_13350 [Anaerolineales bacterium]